MILIGLFYVCWIVGIIIQTVSMVFSGTAFKFIFRTLIGFLCVLLFSMYHSCIFWSWKKVPFVRVKYPYIFGNISSGRHLDETLADFYKNYQTKNYPITGISLLLKPAILITDLKLARSILTEHFHYFQDRGMYQNASDNPMSIVLGSSPYRIWELLRPKLTPAFTPAKIKRMFPVMKTVGDELVKGMEDEIVATENQVEIRCRFSRFVIEIIGLKIFTFIFIQTKLVNFLRIKVTKKKMLKILLCRLSKKNFEFRKYDAKRLFF